MAAETLAPLKSNRTRALQLVLACALLAMTAGVPLRAQTYLDIYNFDCSTGCTPFGQLIQGTDGNLYGTTTSGGSNNFGTIFVISPSGTGYNVLWNFESSTGAARGGLTLSSVDGNFYGTSGGGAISFGTLYRFVVSTKTLTIMHTFSSAEGIPQGPPVEDPHKVLYGVTQHETQAGTAYSLDVATETYTPLKAKVPDFPTGTLVLASDGNLYGTSAGVGSQNGTVFSLTSAGKISLVYPFTGGANGSGPNAPLVQGKDGKLYGTTEEGGTSDVGAIFNVTLPPSPVETTLFSFDGTSNGATFPASGLLAASDGNLYGVTSDGGIDNVGEVFEWEPGGGGSFIPGPSLTGASGATAGADAEANLIEDTNGLFYGVAAAGGANGVGIGDGVLFSVTPANPLAHISLCCNGWVVLDQPVNVIGQGLTGVISVQFGSVAAHFKAGSDTYLTTSVPSAAIDSPVIVTLATGLQLQSQQNVHVMPKIENLDPSSGGVGTPVSIVGGGFTSTSRVSFGGVGTGNFTVMSPSLIQATVPSGAVSGKIEIITPNGSSVSKQTFTVN